MVNIEELKHFLELKDSDLKKLKTEQLRLLLGILRYSTRIVQRELNTREEIISSASKSDHLRRST